MDLNKLKADYEQGSLSYKQLADKYGTTVGAVRYRIRKNRWTRKNVNKADNSPENNTKTCITSENVTLSRTELITDVADKLLFSLARAVGELDNYTLKNKVKIKTIEYSEESGKAESEEIEERESVAVAKGIVDRSELRQLVTALRDIKEIYEFESRSENKIEELIRGLCDDIH